MKKFTRALAVLLLLCFALPLVASCTQGSETETPSATEPEATDAVTVPAATDASTEPATEPGTDDPYLNYTPKDSWLIDMDAATVGQLALTGDDATEWAVVEDADEGPVLKITAKSDANNPSVKFAVNKLGKYQANDYPYIVFKVRASTDAHMRIDFGSVGGTSVDTVYSCKHGKVNANEWDYVILDMTDESWLGRITYLRVHYDDVVMAGETVEISSIRFCKNATDAYGVTGHAVPSVNIATELKYEQQHTEEGFGGLDITNMDHLVGICYSVWFTAILGNAAQNGYAQTWYNVSEVLAGKAEWGPYPAFHYWAKPEVGYYTSDNKEVIRKHMTQLAEAGVDMIFLDLTNAGDGYLNIGADRSYTFNGYWDSYIGKPITALLDTITEMREEGLQTPYVVLWTEDGKCDVIYDAYWNEFYNQDKWKDCFVYWDGKPLICCWGSGSTKIPEQFSFRGMNGLHPYLAENQWAYTNIRNEPCYSTDGSVEQMSICTACQETYMSRPTAHGRNHGIYYYTQWRAVYEMQPKIAVITWWNEWTAQRLTDGNEYFFTDEYNQEYSRDIEPMEGGHGDTYYQWTKQYIWTYKAGNSACPRLVEEGY